MSELGEWEEARRVTGERLLGGLGSGEVRTEELNKDGHALVREVWRPAEGNGVAVRVGYVNRSDRPVRLDRLMPLLLECTLATGDASWSAWLQARHKHELPVVVHVQREADAQAGSDAARGAAASAFDPDRDPAAVKGADLEQLADPFALFRAVGADGPHFLIVGFLTLTSQMGEHRMPAAPNGALRVTSTCHFDGAEVAPGATRFSEWVWLDHGKDMHLLVERYIDAVARVADVPPPPEPPSVYCSWYYAASGFSEADLHENLAVLADRPLPLDVIQIDSCWEQRWADWEPNAKWPSGMEDAARRIKALGYAPGIWTCPFLVDRESVINKEHPEWLLRRRDGEHVYFRIDGLEMFVLDTSRPEVQDWLERTFRRLRAWGFTYHKLDFTRGLILDPEARFHDTGVTRAEAYRKGIEAIRRGIGPDAYLLVCGGLYGPAIGLADGQRTGSDVHSRWDNHTLNTLRQTLMRSWMSRLWHTDPDALMIRRRETPHRDQSMSLGSFTDAEAHVLTLNQYLSGGLVCVSERLVDFDQDRLDLWRHIVPSAGAPAVARDLFDRMPVPAIYHTVVTPRAQGLPSWHTVTLINSEDRPSRFDLRLDESTLGSKRPDQSDAYVIWESVERRLLGVVRWGDSIPTITVSARSARLLRIAPWDGRKATLLGTDLHFSGGGVEISTWESDGDQATFRLETPWRCDVTVQIAFPGSVEGVDPASPTPPPQSGIEMVERVVAVGERGGSISVKRPA